MEVDPKQRYQTAGELLADVQRAAQLAARSQARAVGTAGGAAISVATPAPRAGVDRRGRSPAWRSSARSPPPGWRTGPPTLTDRDSILIGQFENTTADPVFDETLSDGAEGPARAVAVPRHHPGPTDPRDAATRCSGPPTSGSTHAVAREVCQRLGVKAMLDGIDRGARQPLRADARPPPTARPARRSRASRPKRRPRSGARRARRDRVVDADQARRIAAVDQAVRRADRAGDHAVAGGAQGLHARPRGAAARARARVGRLLQPGDRKRPASSRRPTRRCRPSMAASANGGAAKSTRGSPTASPGGSASASGCSSPTSTTTASPAIRTSRRDAGAVEGGVSARLPAGQRAGADPQPARPLRSRGRRSAGGAAAQSRPSVPAVEPGVRLSRARPLRGGAQRSAEQAVKLGVATTPTRRLLYQLGLVAGDGSAAAHLDWAKGKPREFDLVSAQAQIAGVRRTPARGGRALSTRDRHGARRAALQRHGVGLRGAPRADRGALPRSVGADRPHHATSSRRIDAEADAPGDAAALSRRGGASAWSAWSRKRRRWCAGAEQRYPESTLSARCSCPRRGRRSRSTAASRLRRSRRCERRHRPSSARSPAWCPSTCAAKRYLLQARYPAAVAASTKQVLDHRGSRSVRAGDAAGASRLARARARSGDRRQRAARLRRAVQDSGRTADADFAADSLAARAEYAGS